MLLLKSVLFLSPVCHSISMYILSPPLSQNFPSSTFTLACLFQFILFQTCSYYIPAFFFVPLILSTCHKTKVHFVKCCDILNYLQLKLSYYDTIYQALLT